MAGAENVEPGVTGFHFDLASDESLDRALVGLREPETVRRLSEAAYEGFWTDPPTLEAHVRGLGAIYESVLSG